MINFNDRIDRPFYSEIWEADFQLLCEQFGTNGSEVFSSRLKIGFVDI